jgi:hypothetical protein
VKDTLHTRGLRGRCRGIHPVHDLLKGFCIGKERQLIEQDVELRAIGADELYCLIDELPVPRAGTQMPIVFSFAGYAEMCCICQHIFDLSSETYIRGTFR